MGSSGRGQFNRRDFIAGLGAIPLLPAFRNEQKIKGEPTPSKPGGNRETIGIGLIGFGFRGEQLARAAKFAHPDWLAKQGSQVLGQFSEQQDLDIAIRGVCDIYNVRLERGLTAAGKIAKGTRYYQDLLSREDIDAVIIASPDHWHARMAMDAARAGKHIYLEKCMTRTVDEAIALRDAVKQHRVVFQLGHQGRQRDLNQKAKDLIEKETLGRITLIETTTNRNDPASAWVWPVDEKANGRAIDWDLFQETAPEKIPFNAERFFRWRCYWAYGTGMAGDLLTHEYDTVNAILNLGIPHTANASGGIYYYRDGREVPDVFHANYEFPERGFTLTYSGTLANGIPRGTLVMGHDATLELGRSLKVWAEKQSTRYRSRIEAGMINPDSPVVNYDAGEKGVDGVTSATSKYFADRGLISTFRDGKRVNTTNLHLAEWLNCIRNGGTPSCNIDQGFQEAITAHMATISYKEGRKVTWDAVQEKIE